MIAYAVCPSDTSLHISTTLHNVTTQTTVILILVAVEFLNLTSKLVQRRWCVFVHYSALMMQAAGPSENAERVVTTFRISETTLFFATSVRTLHRKICLHYTGKCFSSTLSVNLLRFTIHSK